MTAKEVSLKDYVEGRFDRLIKDIDEKLRIQQQEFIGLIAANDLRYQQRFEAQGKALDAAFGAAKEAVSVALVGVDRAAIKAEQAAEKRFADLGTLIKEQFKGSTEKLDATIKRIEVVEERLNTSSGEILGGQKTKEDSRDWWKLLAAIGGVLLALWVLLK